ncbi:aminopeptidase Ey-like [Halichondria panicea]|uniref:aminopeptidase Ey-like n=1 Tax=Halichondria panicea TaxID=6063 RepID=UPI00312B9718
MSQPAYSDLSAASDSDQDGVGLVLTDSDSSKGRSRKYVVTSSRRPKPRLRMPTIFQSLSRNEIICIIVGMVAFVTIVALFIVVGVVASSQSSAGAANSTQAPPIATPTTQPPTDTTTVLPITQPPTDTTTAPPITQPPTDITTAPPISTAPPPKLWDNVRLPATIRPDLYRISLTVDLDSFAVSGTVDITCQVLEATSYILLHAREMEINNDESNVQYSNTMVDFEGTFQSNDFYVLSLSQEIGPGEVVVHLSFDYNLSEVLSGFYRSSYTDSTGQQRYLATTQFESTDARKAFPCFDEPSLKANFVISITHLSEYHAVSNMPALSRVDATTGDSMVTTHFQSSVKMSTYLVAFIVSDFECMGVNITENRSQPLRIRVCSNPLIVDKTEYALRVAMDVIQFYERRFNISYPLPKQDLFAIPDFAAGAMENWGLITYRETAVLYDATSDPATSKRRVATVIAHELAHQWFGNLVTMAWWDGLWLNEGFATFMEYLGTDNAEPSWNMLDLFFVEDLSSALMLDSLNESHPIIQPVNNPDEIGSLFDTISYAKGASVIRMIQHYLTEERFWAGITHYLTTHQYGNAETSQLWDALQLQGTPGAVSVGTIMDTWTLQTGYPVFTVDQTNTRLTQSRFLAVSPQDNSQSNAVWITPFSYITETNPTPTIMLVTEESTSYTWPVGNGWIKANVGQYGVYRVNYELSNWQLLTQYLVTNPNSPLIPPVDRAGLLDDAFALSSAGQLGSEVALGLSHYLAGEREYIPWTTALTWFTILGRRLSLTPLYGQYANFVRSLLDPVVGTFSFNGTNLSHLQIYLRAEVFQASWSYGNKDIENQASALFQLWKTQNTTIEPDLKSLVYRTGVASGSVSDWDYLWGRYNSESDPYDKRLMLRALAFSTEPWVLNRFLSYTLDRIRSQDQLSVIVYVSWNIHGRSLAWNFFRNNWEYLVTNFGRDGYFGRLIRYITQSFSTEFELQEVIDFFSDHADASSATRSIKQAIETIRGNIDWINNNENTLANILSGN